MKWHVLRAVLVAYCLSITILSQDGGAQLQTGHLKLTRKCTSVSQEKMCALLLPVKISNAIDTAVVTKMTIKRRYLEVHRLLYIQYPS